MKELDIAWPAGCAGRAGRTRQRRGVSRMLRRRGARRHAAGAAARCRPPGRRCCRTRGNDAAAAADAQAAARGRVARAGAEPARRPDRTGSRRSSARRDSVDVVAAYTAEPAAEGPPPALMWRLQTAAARGRRGPLGRRLGEPGGHAAAAPSGDLAAWAKRQPLLVPHAAIMAHAQAVGFEPGGGLRGPARSGRTATISRQQSRPDAAGACRQRCRQKGTSCLEFGPAESLGDSGRRKG